MSVSDPLTSAQIPGRLWAFLRRPGPRGGDVLLAVALFVVHLFVVVYLREPHIDAPAFTDVDGRPVVMEHTEPSSFQDAALAVPMAFPLAWRRSRPITVLAVVLATVLLSDNEAVTIPAVAALAIAAFSVAAHVAQLRTAALVSMGATVLLMAKFPDAGGGTPGMLALAVMATMWVTGRTIAGWRNRAGVLHRRALRAEREREVAVALERARIARELHDVVSHNVSVMVIQAGAARMVLESDPAAATEALHAVEASGRETMAELRRMLDVLAPQETAYVGPQPPEDPTPTASGGLGVRVGARSLGDPSGDDPGPPLSPQPDLARLPALVERVAATGQDVRLDVLGEPRSLPPGAELTAYRVVQEALTNAMRYAPGARTDVSVVYGVDELRIDVADDGAAGVPPRAPVGAGRGLVGLTERIALHGGELHAARRPTGGYRLRAVIPVPRPAPTGGPVPATVRHPSTAPESPA